MTRKKTTQPMILIRFLGEPRPGSRSVIEFTLGQGSHEHYKLVMDGKPVALRPFNNEKVIAHNGGSVICLDGRQIYLVEAQIAYPGDDKLTMCPLIRSGRHPVANGAEMTGTVRRERTQCKPHQASATPDPRSLLGRPRGCRKPSASLPDRHPVG